MKNTFIITFFTFHAIFSLAQEVIPESKTVSNKGLGLGLRYGIGSNTITSSNTGGISLSSLISPLNFGFILEGNISDNFAIQPELQYIQKGFTMSSGGISVDAKFNYLGLNILPKLKFGNENIEAALFAGPSLNANLSAKASANGQSEDIPDAGGLDLGAIFGVGIANKFKSGKLFFDIRYNLGLSDISTESPQISTDKLNQLGINIGYIFKVN
jgi:hypothetical protein